MTLLSRLGIVLGLCWANLAFAEPSPSVSASDFSEVDQALANGSTDRAADSLWRIVQEDASSDRHAEAWLRLGALYDQLGFPYVSLLSFSKGLALSGTVSSEQVPAVKTVASTAILPALNHADRVSDRRILGEALAKNIGFDVDTTARSRMALLAAETSFQDGNLSLAQAMIALVDKSSAEFPRAEWLRGVVLAQQGKPVDALAPLLTAQALSKNSTDPRFGDLVDITLARVYYAAGNFPSAIATYASVSRGDTSWPEAEFERAWSHFRLSDMGGTIALLNDHHTPFLASEWLPEASLLRTYAFFNLCKFRSATESIDEFTAIYQPLKQQISLTLPTMSSEMVFADIAAAPNSSKLPRSFIASFAREDRFLKAQQAIVAADSELKRLKIGAGHFQQAADLVESRKKEIVSSEGQRIQSVLIQRSSDIDSFLTHIKITRLDMLTLEADLYEKAAVTGKLDVGDRIGRLRKSRGGRNLRIWPNEGEVWADELGYYRLDIRSDCPSELSGP